MDDHSKQALALSAFLTDGKENEKMASASKWSLGIVVALNILLDPADDMNKVLPAEMEPSTDGTIHCGT